ncbi:hypothetical protein GTW51_21390 [Aurantimonas aggregata]|uniref:Uncharacterized protein n=1 Tax=Aurantimonas aggregata TaxID=2047720 RepID=A0A6L9MMT9_9HYPH|nr:hypothetical protein [Aurantimonas aggregata]
MSKQKLFLSVSDALPPASGSFPSSEKPLFAVSRGDEAAESARGRAMRMDRRINTNVRDS